jgi:galactose mutarotase-like enzyme
MVCSSAFPPRTWLTRYIGVCLHGGERGLDTQTWVKIGRNESKLFSTDDNHDNSVIHQHVSPSGSDGFPLTLLIEMKVELGKDRDGDSTQEFIIRAKVLDDGLATKQELSAGTPVNCTIHWGFHLNNWSNLNNWSSDEREDVLDHKLFVNVRSLIHSSFRLSLAEFDGGYSQIAAFLSMIQC